MRTLLVAITLLLQSFCLGQTNVESLVLIDKIYKGTGTIDLLKDISSSQLSDYFNQSYNMLLLGVDVNEDASGTESRDAMGVAIKQATLEIITSQGTFTYTDFFTSTTSMLKEAGSTEAFSYYTLFGDSGSSQITGTGSTDISKFDDVLWFEDINYLGDISSAKLKINFLNVDTYPPSSLSNESFFDFSGGFEDFALFSVADAQLVESEKIGQTGSTSINFTETTSVNTSISNVITEQQQQSLINKLPAAPLPPALFVFFFFGWFAFRAWFQK